MPLSRTRDYLSIGEVLESLRGDFADISISKIRFLESEGLIAPKRTPSGYRKFYPDDLERLKQVLLLQRDHFMPLRIIKDRLDLGELSLPAAAPSAARAANGRPASAEEMPAPDLTSVSLSRSELIDAAGLSEPQLASLEEFGILPKDGAPSYDGEALLVAKAARGFFELGVEARHLRMYRQFAEREASFFQQIVTPVAGKRDAKGLERASATARRLEQLGQAMHHALLRSSVRDAR